MSGRRYASLSELDESAPSHSGGSSVGTIGGMDRTPAELDFSDRAEDKATRFRIMLRAVLGELICTTTFLFTALGAVINLKRSYPNDVSLFPIAMSFGLAAVGNIYAFAEVSGAHFNPAVTFATWINGDLSNRKAVSFVLAQLAGSLLACSALVGVFPEGLDAVKLIAIAPAPDAYWGKVFGMEMALTFILVFTIYTVAFELIPKPSPSFKYKADAKGLTLYSVSPQSKSGFAPLIIGFMIMVLVMTGSSVSGSGFNPARAFGPAVFTGVWTDHWIYWCADLSGALLAVGVRRLFTYFFGGIKVKSEAEVINVAKRRSQASISASKGGGAYHLEDDASGMLGGADDEVARGGNVSLYPMGDSGIGLGGGGGVRAQRLLSGSDPSMSV